MNYHEDSNYLVTEGSGKFLSVFVLIMLLLAGILLITPSENKVSAQPVPEYRDASNGLPTYSLWVSHVSFFDIDGDGTRDVFSLGPRKGDGDNTLNVWKWDGNSWTNDNIAEGLATIEHSSYGGFSFSDFDTDGDWDVGVGSHGKDAVEAYQKMGPASWLETSTGLETAQDGWSIDFGDYNSDGNMDLLEGGFWGQDVRAYAGSGVGGWIDQSGDLPQGHTAVEAYYFDANNDGHLDILASWGHAGWVYHGDGNGGWTNASEGLPYTWVGNSVNWGDFNNDGLSDIILTYEGVTEAYAGDGNGNWTDTSAGLPEIEYNSVVLADLNDDKYDDLVGMQSSDPGLVDVYLYSGANSWVKDSTTVMQGNAKGWRLDVGDFDNNGFNDIVAGFGSDNDIDYPGSIKVWQETTEATELGITLTYPDGFEVLTEGSVRFIEWLSSVPTTMDPVDVTLEYSTGGDSGPWISIAEDLPNIGIYQWEVPEGISDDAFIRIMISDGADSIASDMNDNAFGIGVNPNINHRPEITILTPSEENETVDTEFLIEWNATDSDEDEITVDLYYDEDTDSDNGMHLIAEDLSGSENLTWNTTEIGEGTYSIYGYVEDEHGKNGTGYSQGTILIEHDTGDPDPPENRAPTLEITQPDGTDDVADTKFTIRWEAEDPDPDSLTFDLYFDIDQIEGNGAELIAEGLTTDGTHVWEVEQISEGEYYILGYVDDNNGSRVMDYSSGVVTITHDDPPPPDENEPPEIEVSIAPVEDQDDTFLIEWTASDPDEDDITIDLFYDSDMDPEEGMIAIITGLEQITGEYEWDVSGLVEDSYYVYAVAMDPDEEEGTDHSEMFIVAHPILLADFEITFFNIAASSLDAGETVFIQAKVKNVGGADASGTILITAGGEVIHNTSIEIKQGKEKNINAVWIALEGNHSITIDVRLDEDPTPENNMEFGNWIAEVPRIDPDEDEDIGVYLIGGGIVGILSIIALAFFLRKGPPSGPTCPSCGASTEFFKEENDHYCWNCEEYLEIKGQVRK